MTDGPVLFDPLAEGPAGTSFLLADKIPELLLTSAVSPLVKTGAATEAPPAAPGGTSPLLGDAWSEGIIPGTDSSGKVDLNVLHPEVKTALQKLHQAFGAPITVTSGAGGVHTEGSEHGKFNAVDLSIAGMSPDQLAKLVTSAKAAGFTGIGLAHDHLHLDTRAGTPVVFSDNSGGKYPYPTTWGEKSVNDWRAALLGGGGSSSPGEYAGPAKGDFFHSLGMAESNYSNVYSKVDPDVAGPGTKSQGIFQINTPTWQQFAPPEVLAKFPNAMSAPEAVQRQVVANIPLGRFGPRTVEMLKRQYGFGDEAKSLTIGQLAARYGAGGGGNPLGGEGGSGVGRGAASPVAAASPAELFAGQMKLQLLKGLFPQHQFTQVEYDPFKLVPKSGESVDVNKGVG